MDEVAFERWSQSLAALRKKRQEELEQVLQEKADSFQPPEFYATALRSFETVLERWYELEQESWQSTPPAAPAKALQNINVELESIAEFELQSIERDSAFVTSRITWDPASLDEAQKNFATLSDEIRKKYLLKLKTLSAGDVHAPTVIEAPRPVQYSNSFSRSGGGLASVGMFFLGLLLGGGPSFYFMDQRQKAEARCEEERTRLLNERRELADSMALLQANFSEVVTGKSSPIPQLEAEMAQAKQALNEKISVINSEAASQREHLRKRVPPGDRLERALAEVETDRLRRIKRYENEYAPNMRVLEKRILLYRDLVGTTQK